MPTLGTFDRDRIEDDIEQAEEMLERTQALFEAATDPEKRDALEAEILILENRLEQLKALLQ